MTTVEMCQKCKTSIAEVTVIHFENGQKKYIKLCEECAKRHDELQQLAAVPEFFKKFAENIFEPDGENAHALKCPNCGMTVGTFEANGLLGCEQCYHTFEDELTALLQRIHGSHKHIGSRPRPVRKLDASSDMQSLKKRLQAAIAAEDFEQAAECRDLIRDLEREMQRRQNGH
ncbi:MAG: UvrB/UvrC motif-containing protein [Deferribacteres bacterium]|nr:UvrB/UvrC motif-containing protein [candidate division KSB1 bacterium]MCB9511646.1 UvrB/UvrC motif-containing protein [Deferribacteres bacterium]